MSKRKTKNHIKYKKKYIVDGHGNKYAPYVVNVRYSGYEPDLDIKLIELAERNSGTETGSGSDFSERDISFDFFTAQGVKTFVKKAVGRYSYKFSLGIMVETPVIEYSEVDVEDL